MKNLLLLALLIIPVAMKAQVVYTGLAFRFPCTSYNGEAKSSFAPAFAIQVKKSYDVVELVSKAIIGKSLGAEMGAGLHGHIGKVIIIATDICFVIDDDLPGIANNTYIGTKCWQVGLNIGAAGYAAHTRNNIGFTLLIIP
jgi:hypothetical protein